MSSKGNQSSRAVTANAACPVCQGPLPWVEEDQHAHEANGKICEQCGHFYGIPAFEDSNNYRYLPTRLLRYCWSRNWDWAMARFHYVPEEASFVSERALTALKAAIFGDAPFSLISALIEAHPEGVNVGPFEDDLETPIWLVLVKEPMEKKWVETCKLLLSKNSDILLDVLSDESMESPLAHLSRYNRFFFQASQDTSTPAHGVLDNYTCEDEEGHFLVEEGELRHMFDLCSILVKASYHKELDEDIVENKPVLHAMAGSQDPFVVEEGFPALAVKIFPEELLLQDETNGNCPLHIAASTINRDKKEYYDWSVYDDSHEREKRLEEREAFMDSFCKHNWWVGEMDLEDYIIGRCECPVSPDANFRGCTCGSGSNDQHADMADWRQYNCSTCLKEYAQEHGCDCPKEWVRAKQLYTEECNCNEAFEYYYAKMQDEHRNDKKAVIKTLLNASPLSASLRNNIGQLPIHLAVGKGKKCWDGAVCAMADAFPEGVGMKDPQNHLYPFMAAASIDDLDTAFELLRFCPNVITWLLDRGHGQGQAGL